MRIGTWTAGRLLGIVSSALLVVGAVDVQAQNLVVNPGFTGGLGSWTTLPASNYTVSWDSIQGNTAAGSAAVSLTVAAMNTDAFFLSQCVPALASKSYDVIGSFRYPAGGGTTPTGILTLQAFSDLGCTSSAGGPSNLAISTLSTAVNTWATQTYLAGFTTSATTTAVKILLHFRTPDSGLASGVFDDIFFGNPSPVELLEFAID
jgi:hypothetical protein